MSRDSGVPSIDARIERQPPASGPAPEPPRTTSAGSIGNSGASPPRSASHDRSVSGSGGSIAKSTATIGPWKQTKPVRRRTNAKSDARSEPPRWILGFAAISAGSRCDQRPGRAPPAAREEDRGDSRIAQEPPVAFRPQAVAAREISVCRAKVFRFDDLVPARAQVSDSAAELFRVDAPGKGGDADRALPAAAGGVFKGAGGPLSRILSSATIPLGPGSRPVSSSQPGNGPRRGREGRPPFPYLALLHAGFTVPPALPPGRCALTAPFHPCRLPGEEGGLFSVALSFAPLPGRPGVTRRAAPLEFGLSSPIEIAAIAWPARPRRV